jgi:hypothetical protein
MKHCGKLPVCVERKIKNFKVEKQYLIPNKMFRGSITKWKEMTEI